MSLWTGILSTTFHFRLILFALLYLFIKNYNKFSKEEEELIADEVVLLALLDRNELNRKVFYPFITFDNLNIAYYLFEGAIYKLEYD